MAETTTEQETNQQAAQARAGQLQELFRTAGKTTELLSLDPVIMNITDETTGEYNYTITATRTPGY